jgi:hypothetical protein
MERSVGGRVSPSLLSTAMLLCLLASAPQAAEYSSTDELQSSLTLYLWLPSVEGDLKYAVNGGNAGVDAGAILDALQMAFMGALEFRKERWSLLADVIYLDLSDDNGSRVSLPGGGSIQTQVDLQLSGWQLGLYGGYELHQTSRASLDVLAGVRHLSLDADATLGIAGPLPPSLSTRKLSRSGRHPGWGRRASGAHRTQSELVHSLPCGCRRRRLRTHLAGDVGDRLQGELGRLAAGLSPPGMGAGRRQPDSALEFQRPRRRPKVLVLTWVSRSGDRAQEIISEAEVSDAEEKAYTKELKLYARGSLPLKHGEKGSVTNGTYFTGRERNGGMRHRLFLPEDAVNTSL